MLVVEVLIVTRAIFPTPLSASQGRSPLATSMLRTVPPPLGIGSDCIYFVSGLNRTSILEEMDGAIR